jgi:hypothetical protein
MSAARCRPLAAALAAVAAASALAPGAAAGIDGFPGSTWGDLYWELPSEGRQDAVLEGWIRQGVAWHRWAAGSARLVLQTYGTVRYRWDSLGLDWNNHVTPGVGLALDLSLPRMPAVTVGVEAVDRWNTRSGTTTPCAALFANWYHSWGFLGGGWPGATWGDVRWEIPSDAREDLIAEGWLRQGVVLERWRRGDLAVVVSPYALVRWKVDTLGLDWNNRLGPGAGLALDLDGVKGLQPGLAVEYAWERNLVSAGSVHRLDLVARWYGWWDLSRR